jgi:hypothetical protein
MRQPDLHQNLATALEDERSALENEKRSGEPLSQQAKYSLAFNVKNAFEASHRNDLLTR